MIAPRIGVLLGGALLLGCSSTAGPARLTEAIRDGELAPDRAAVVAVVNFAGGHCSGSLILPNLVLTAQHCIAETADDRLDVDCAASSFVDPDSAGAVFVVARPEISIDPEDYRAVAEIRLPEGDDRSLCGNDVALLRLAEPIPEEEIVPLVPRVDQAVEENEVYTAVGFGEVGPDEDGDSGVRRARAGLTVVCVGASCGESQVRPTEWLGSGGPCPGDSGGPALDALGRVIGAVSRGGSGCSTPVFSEVPSFSSFIREAAIDASDADGHEPPGWARGFSSDPRYADPIGGSCKEAPDCVSGLCGDQGRCTRVCDEDGPCPESAGCEDGVCRFPSEKTLHESCAYRAPPSERGLFWWLGLSALGAARLARRKRRAGLGSRRWP